MSVQRWAHYTDTGMQPVPEGPWILYADHARIVAEAEQRGRDGVFRIFNSDPKAHSITNEKHVMFCAECHAIRHVYEQGKADAEQAHAAALVEAVSQERRAWLAAGYKDSLHRTLTADDPGYHSQRCLHCDHIRATHTLTAHGCIGHALPGRPGADCPCAEFIHDGEVTPQVKPCSTCGEPVAYLTARPGWAGGWLHHPSRPLDGHPAAIDGEATT